MSLSLSLQNKSKLPQTYLKMLAVVIDDFSTEKGMDIDKQEKRAFLQKMTKKSELSLQRTF